MPMEPSKLPVGGKVLLVVKEYTGKYLETAILLDIKLPE